MSAAYEDPRPTCEACVWYDSAPMMSHGTKFTQHLCVREVGDICVRDVTLHLQNIPLGCNERYEATR